MIGRRTTVLASGIALALMPAAYLPAHAAASTSVHVVASPRSDILIPTYPTVRRGEHSLSRVRTVQYLLRARPTLSGQLAADGVFGPLTQSAVRAFQGAVGLPATGVVNPATWRRLVLTSQPGSRGEHVRALQALLNVYGRTHTGYRLVVDGVYGPRTAAAVYRYQTAVDITNDGRANTTTWAFLVFDAGHAEAGT